MAKTQFLIKKCSPQTLGFVQTRELMEKDILPQSCQIRYLKFVFFLSRMLGALPMALTQVATSQGYFPKWQLPKCEISQAATLQVCPNCSARPLACSNLDQRSNHYPILAAAFGPYCSLRRFRRPNLTFGKLLLRKLHIWEVSTWEIVIWEVAPGKISLD